MKKRVLILGVLFVLLFLFTTYAESRIKRGGIVTITSSKQGVLIKNFNPFSPKALYSTFGCFYETLIFANSYTGKIEPWLAQSYFWSDDLKTLTFKIRKNIQWNDGKPLTADDVIFTLSLGKKDKALDKAGIWKQGLVDVKKIDSHTVSFVFNNLNTVILPQIGNIYIVPRHIWKFVKDPSKWTGNDQPVGTGPFIFDKKSFTTQSFRLKTNPLYWQKGEDGKPLPYIDGIQFISATGNAQASMKIVSGQVDWGTYNIPNIERIFRRRDPKHNHYWLPGGSFVYLNLNNGKLPFSNVNLRKAVFQAINPKEITRIMNSGAIPASQSGVNKGYLSWVPKAAEKYALAYDPEAAVKRIEKEGYKKNSRGIYEKDGRELSFKIYVPTGWNDWITAIEAVNSQLLKVGIEGKVTQNAWPSPFFDNIRTGAYVISIDYASAGFSPYFQYNNILPSRHWAPIGENASKHSQVRYKNPDVDKKMAQYSKTADPEEQLRLMGEVLTAVMRDTPLVPLFNNPIWFEYSTRRFTGWPNEKNPYTAPKTSGMDKMPVLLNIRRVK
jgi:peptide/nickel transport system substrate-binding protein